MYQRKDKKVTYERVYLVIFVSVVIIGAGVYGFMMTLLGNMKNEFDHFFNGFDVESRLFAEADINYTFLEQRANEIEQLIDMYHMPYNMTGEGWDYYAPVAASWNYNSSTMFWNNTQLLETFDPLDALSPYNNESIHTYSGDRAHTALYEGVYCMGEAFRYAVAKRNGDTGNMTAAEDKIYRIVKAYELLSYISNSSAFVRYAIPNTTLAYEKFPGHWNPAPYNGTTYNSNNDHYIVEYRGYTWSLSRHLSRDVSIGIMLGLSMSYALCDNATIREIAGRIIDRTVQYFYDCNWRIVDTDGVTHTSGDFIGARPLIEGGSILTFLQMGKMVNPEKWGPVYAHYAYDRGLAFNIGRTMRFGFDLATKIFSGYYGCNFLFNNAPTLLFLETDPVLREIYTRNWLNVLHDFTKLHRNANFDVVYLLCHAVVDRDNLHLAPTDIVLQDYDMEIWKTANIAKPTDKAYVENFMVRDIKDALMRYALVKYPNRDYYYATNPGTYPNVHQQLTVNGVTLPLTVYSNWTPVASPAQDLMNSVMGLIGEDFENPGLYTNSLPADMREAEDIMWQRNSFARGTTESLRSLSSPPGRYQAPMGPEYLSVYWIAKYLELF